MCSKLYNKFNIEKTVLGEVFELPKLPKDVKPFNLIMGADEMIFKSITNLKK